MFLTGFALSKPLTDNMRVRLTTGLTASSHREQRLISADRSENSGHQQNLETLLRIAPSAVAAVSRR